MATLESGIGATAEITPRYIEWSPVICGAIIAAATSFVLITFGSAIGLSVASSAPTWRDASAALALLSGLYLILVAFLSFGIGGYVAGMTEATRPPALIEHVEFRDGIHGITMWALAIMIAAILVAATTGTLSRALPTTAANGTSAENLLAPELDRLFRSERRAPDNDLSYDRAEAGRILLDASGHRGIASDDRAYLVRLVALRTALPPADAERRVDDVIARSSQAIGRARHMAVILGFSAAAALLIGAALAWYMACLGGRQRDGSVTPSLEWWRWSRVVAHR